MTSRTRCGPGTCSTRSRCPGVGQPGGPPYLLKTYIGVDPSDGSEDSDEQAYTVIGKGSPEDRHIYVAENWGGQESPVLFAKRVIRKAVEWNATVVVEKNHGGKWLTAVFAQAQKDMHTSVRVEMVHASDAKRARAEPVAVMYDRYSEDGRPLVLHCHRTWKDDDGHVQVDEHMPELEDCMATFTGAAGERSPDRLDRLVWAASKFLRETFGPPGKSGVRKWAGAQDLGNIGVPEEARAQRKMREIHERGAQRLDDAPWSWTAFRRRMTGRNWRAGHGGMSGPGARTKSCHSSPWWLSRLWEQNRPMDDVTPEQDPLRSAFTAEIEELTERIRELNAAIEAGKPGRQGAAAGGIPESG